MLEGYVPQRRVLEQIVDMFERKGEDGERFVLRAYTDAFAAFDARERALRAVSRPMNPVGTSVCLRESFMQ